MHMLHKNKYMYDRIEKQNLFNLDASSFDFALNDYASEKKHFFLKPVIQ